MSDLTTSLHSWTHDGRAFRMLNVLDEFTREVSAPETALLTCGEEGLLEGIWRQGGGVETGRQQGFDLGE